MKKTTIKLAAAVALSCGAISSANAYYLGSAGSNIAIKFGDMSWLIDRDNTLGNGSDYIMSLTDLPSGLSKGDELQFSFLISSIHPENTSNPAFSNDILPGEELTGFASGLLIDEFSIVDLGSLVGPSFSGQYDIKQNFTGGSWSVYHDTTPDYDTSSLALAISNSTNGTAIFGGFFALIAGNNEGVNPYTPEVGADNSTFTTTLSLDFDQNNDGTLNDLVTGNQGASRGFLHETLDGGIFVPDNFGLGKELSFESTLTTTGLEPWATLASNDPTRAKLVPEPASIALLGAGLAGFGASIRRRSKQQGS